MRAVLVALAVAPVSVLRSPASLHLEILALRHQLAVLQGGGRRPRLKPGDRLLWVWLSRAWSGWQDDITEHPTARWTAQQVVEAFPWDTAPQFLLRDRDGIYGADFRRRAQSIIRIVNKNK